MSICKAVFKNVYVNRKNIFQTYCELFKKMPFYAVAKGRSVGIFMTWPDCENQVKGFSGARYKKFDTITSAQNFIDTEGNEKVSTKATAPTLNKAYDTAINTYNLKRASSNDQSKIFTKKKKSKRNSESENDFSDDFDDTLDTMLEKQMDDIENRLNKFEKSVNKIMKGSKSERKTTILIDPPQRNVHTNENKFNADDEGYVQVYTDGACSANGKTSARAGLGVYWGDGHKLNISEPVSGRATNNCGEIQAATKAIKQALDNGVSKLSINTDSKFLINSVTKWMPGWKKKGWKLKSGEPVKNEKDFKDLDSVQHKLQIKWNYVEAHRGLHGNEMADQLAKAGAALYDK